MYVSGRRHAALKEFDEDVLNMIHTTFGTDGLFILDETNVPVHTMLFVYEVIKADDLRLISSQIQGFLYANQFFIK